MNLHPKDRGYRDALEYFLRFFLVALDKLEEEKEDDARNDYIMKVNKAQNIITSELAETYNISALLENVDERLKYLEGVEEAKQFTLRQPFFRTD